ncbi:unnamed protein product, partial [Mesorhabditis belari]|uniref:Poly A polymerase head domain-containing protein n=1 Tax=Mesorhabditis belari TaxID=2138241 RepID=A0AAF3F247_9BILA
MARVVPYAAIQFCAHEQWKELLQVDKNGVRTPGWRYIAGSLAAMTATMITYPLDTAKARLSTSNRIEYPTLVSVFKKTYQAEGITSLYRGMWPTLLGVIPYAGTSFFTYESFKLAYEEETGHTVTPLWRLFFGAVAGLIGQSSSYPLDIVRRRMQTGRVPENWGVLQTLATILKNEGLVRGLYKGLSMNWIKGPIAVGVSFTTYDFLFAKLKTIHLSSKGTKKYTPITKQSQRIVPIPMTEVIEPRRQKLVSPDFDALFTPPLKKLNELFAKNGYELRIAGGAVRDLLMGIWPADVDFATTATPTMMKDLFEREQIRMLHKKGEDHGTITCRIDDKENFEITTVDKVCDGRRAEVEYTTEWQLDANRRDLTINSLFLDLDGTIIDYFGGIEDVHNRRVRFVGDAEQRIQEDYLRILRYFRFFGRIATEDGHDPVTIDAIVRNRDGLLGISAERIWTEFKRIVVGRMAPDVVDCMLARCELHRHLGLPENVNLERFRRVYEKYSSKVESMTMVGSLCNDVKEIATFHARTKLSNVERELGELVVREREKAEKAGVSLDWWKALLVDLNVRPGHEEHKSGTGVTRVLQLGMSVCMEEKLLNELQAWSIPVFPIKGLDLIEHGVAAGPKMRVTVNYLFDLWLKSKYTLTKDELLTHTRDAEIPDVPEQFKPNHQMANEIDHLIQKDDIIWAPYRKGPLWPSKVTAVYSKKVSFNFFPLPENPKRMAVFSAKPTAVFALGITDHLRTDASEDLRVALAHAIMHLKGQGRKVGAKAARYTEHGVEQLHEEDVEYEEFEKIIEKAQQQVIKKKGKKRERSPSEEQDFDEKEESPSTHEENEQAKPSVETNGNRGKRLRRGQGIDEEKREKEMTPKRGKVAPMKETQEVHDSKKDEKSSGDPSPSSGSGDKEEIQQRAPKKRGKTTTNGVPKIPSDEIYEIATRDHKKIITDLINNPSKQMLDYVIPPRNSIKIQFKTGNFITDFQADHLFDAVMRHYMTVHKTAQILPAVHYVANLLIEPLIKYAVLQTGKFTSDEVEAKFVDNHTETNGDAVKQEKRQRMSHPLEDLVRVACQELDKINGTA